MAETPTKTCRTCAQSFPATDEYFPRKGKSLRTYCRPCFRKVMDAYTLAAQQRTKAQKAAGQVPPKPKRHWTPNPTGKGLDPAVAKAPVALPKAPQKVDESFRDVMLRRGRPQWEALADKILERALTGEASLLKYVGEMFLGDETGEQSTLAASLRQLHDVRLAELRRDHAAAWAALGSPGAPEPGAADEGGAGREAAPSEPGAAGAPLLDEWAPGGAAGPAGDYGRGAVGQDDDSEPGGGDAAALAGADADLGARPGLLSDPARAGRAGAVPGGAGMGRLVQLRAAEGRE